MKKRMLATAIAVALAVGGLAVSSTVKAHAGHTITIDDVAVTEGNNAVFQLHLSPPAQGSEKISVTATTAPGSAGSSDFTPKSQTFTFEECDGFCFGASLKVFSVPTTEDTSGEPLETFSVSLSNVSATCVTFFGTPCPTGATISDGTAVGQITDDDGGTPDPNPDPDPNPNPNPTQPGISVNDFNGATTRNPCVFTLTLDRVPTAPVSVSWAVAGATSQISGATTGQVSFAAGDNLRQIEIDVIKQKRRASNLDLLLSGAQGASIDDGSGTCTILKKKRRR